jgi:16S rRNA U516 pseudouridylate synthase RsuA-like enzyme
MDEDRFNMSLRKFLKNVGVTSQQQIEKVVRGGSLGGNSITVKMVLTAEGTDLNHTVEGDIEIG